ncbi:MAG: ABC transporter ATP-binding protein [Lachnospiraceae bacterium]|nr:ABC transporter ATP-binding protein [Lachnospiraceae bacterium]
MTKEELDIINSRRGPGNRRGMQVKLTKDVKKSAGRTIKRILSYMKGKNTLRFIIVLFCILISSLTGVANSMFTRVLIDDNITPLIGQTNPDFSGLIKALTTMVCIYVCGICATYLYNRIMVTISQGILRDVREDMYEHMEKLPIRYFDRHTHGDVMSHYTNDIDTLRQMLSQTMPQACTSIVTIIGVFSAMIYTSPWLTLVVIIALILILNVSRIIAGNSGKFFIKQQMSLGKTNGYIEEMINGQKVIKVFCHEDTAKRDFDALNDELYNNSRSANTFANILMPVNANLGNLLYVLIAVAGGCMAISGFSIITIGAIATFLQLVKSLMMPVTQVSQQLNSIVMALAGADRIFTLMDQDPEFDEGYVSLVNVKEEKGELIETKEKTGMWAWKHPHGDGTLTYTKLAGKVEFHEVDFGYEENKTVLHDITLEAEPGHKIAFVGATGAGKTTITNLINRFYDIADGKIRYDGININKIRKSDLRRSLGIVLQDTNLFTGTVMENIRYGRLDATDEECIAAAKLANADSFIRLLPEGYDTVLTGNGAGISQGQRQLLAIARAAVADPPVMILDEATSSIDTRTELIVQRGMDRLMKGRTVFVIAHRLSTVQNADVIMVLEDGRIIERGNHEDLIYKRGKYFQLYTGAFELE